MYRLPLSVDTALLWGVPQGKACETEGVGKAQTMRVGEEEGRGQ